MNSNLPQTSVKVAFEEYLFNKQHSLIYKTRRWYTQKLNIFSAWCEQNGITLDQVKARPGQSFVQSLSPEYSTYTKHGYVQMVKGFLNWCGDEEDFEHCVSERSVKKKETTWQVNVLLNRRETNSGRQSHLRFVITA